MVYNPPQSRFHPVARLQSYGRDVSREGVFPSSNHSRPSVDQRLWYSLLPPGCADGGAEHQRGGAMNSHPNHGINVLNFELASAK
jgi:hypothetical protein